MHLILSGEGKSDIGYCNKSLGYCEADEFSPRAMALIIDQIIDQWFSNNYNYNYSFLDCGEVTYVSESHLASQKSPSDKKIGLPGKKNPKETKYFYENARSLAIFSKKKQNEFYSEGNNKKKVIAVLFRDSDGTASSERGEYKFKRDSIINGFKKEAFNCGVAMIPRPKSEAWLLCAIKHNPYQSCDKLEKASGNDNSPNSLKIRFENALDSYSSTETAEDLLRSQKIDINKIQMSSFLEFRDELEHILGI